MTIFCKMEPEVEELVLKISTVCNKKPYLFDIVVRPLVCKYNCPKHHCFSPQFGNKIDIVKKISLSDI